MLETPAGAPHLSMREIPAAGENNDFNLTMKMIWTTEIMDIPERVNINVNGQIVEVVGPGNFRHRIRDFKHPQIVFHLAPNGRKLMVRSLFKSLMINRTALDVVLSQLKRMILEVTTLRRLKPRPTPGLAFINFGGEEKDFFMASSGKRKRDDFAPPLTSGGHMPQQESADVTIELLLPKLASSDMLETPAGAPHLSMREIHAAGENSDFMLTMKMIWTTEIMDIPERVNINVNGQIVEVVGPGTLRNRIRDFKHPQIVFHLAPNGRKLMVRALFESLMINRTALDVVLSQLKRMISEVTTLSRFPKPRPTPGLAFINFGGEEKLAISDMLETPAGAPHLSITQRDTPAAGAPLLSMREIPAAGAPHLSMREIPAAGANSDFMLTMKMIWTTEIMDIPERVNINVNGQIVEVVGPGALRNRIRDFKHPQIVFHLAPNGRKLMVRALFESLMINRTTLDAVLSQLKRMFSEVTTLSRHLKPRPTPGLAFINFGCEEKDFFMASSAKRKRDDFAPPLTSGGHMPQQESANMTIELLLPKARKVDTLDDVTITRFEKLKGALVP